MDAQREHSDPPRLITVPRTAELLAVSPRLIWRLIADGELEVVRPGRATRVTVESIDRLVERGGVA